MSTTTLICVLAYLLAVTGLLWWHERELRLDAQANLEDALEGWGETLDSIEEHGMAVAALLCPDQVES